MLYKLYKVLQIISLFIGLFLSCPVFSQIINPYLINIQRVDGLPSLEVYDVFQDSEGYMWFSTDAGQAKYNGKEFKIYGIESGLIDNTNFTTQELSNKDKLFNSLTGKISILHNDTVLLPETNNLLKEKWGNAVNYTTLLGKNDVLWVYNGAKRELAKIKYPYNANKTEFIKLNALGMISIVELEKDRIICNLDEEVTVDKKVHILFANLTGKPEHQCDINLNAEELHNKALHLNILKLSEGEYVFSWGVYLCYIKNYKCVRIERFDTEIIRLCQENSKSFWFCLRSKGAHLVSIQNILQPSCSLLNDLTVTCVTRDHENGYWFSTLEKGVFYCPDIQSRYLKLKNKNESFSSMAYTRQKEILLGTSIYGRLLLYNPNIKSRSERIMMETPTKSIDWTKQRIGHNLNAELTWDDTLIVLETPSIKENFALRTAIVKQLCSDNYFFSISGLGSFIYDIKTKKVIPIKNIQQKMTDGTYCSCEVNGNMWLGGTNSLKKINIDGAKMKEFTYVNKRPCSIYQESNGLLLVGCLDGLYKYENEKLTYLSEKHPQLKLRIIALSKDSKGNLIFATRNNGVFVLTKKEEIISINQSSGLTSNLCRSLYIDKDDAIWVGTNKGITRIILNNKKIDCKSFSLDRGIVYDDIFQLIVEDNKLFALMNTGLFMLPLDESEKSASISPPVHIDEVSVMGKRVFNTSKLQLNYQQTNLNLKFSGLTFKNFGHPEFVVKICKDRDTTINYTKSNELQLANLAPNKYKILVYAKNINNILSLIPATLSFEISPPFWNTTWFYILAIVMGISAVFGMAIFYIRRNQEKRIKQAEINEKMAKLELKALRAQMNPHFMFNCMYSIQGLILKKQDEVANKYLTKLSRLIRNVLQNSSHEFILMQTELRTLQLYIDLEQLRFSNKFDYVVDVDTEIDPDNYLIPPSIIQPFLENSILHGFQHINKKGILTLQLKRVEEKLFVRIEDNGIGRKQAQQQQEKRFEHTSMGANISNERMKLLNNAMSENLEIITIDNYSPEGEALGTIVEFYLPLRNNENKNIDYR